jgi:hypothetical protein
MQSVTITIPEKYVQLAKQFEKEVNLSENTLLKSIADTYVSNHIIIKKDNIPIDSNEKLRDCEGDCKKCYYEHNIIKIEWGESTGDYTQYLCESCFIDKFVCSYCVKFIHKRFKLDKYYYRPSKCVRCPGSSIIC